jgi:hypothetical protein
VIDTNGLPIPTRTSNGELVTDGTDDGSSDHGDCGISEFYKWPTVGTKVKSIKNERLKLDKLL